MDLKQNKDRATGLPLIITAELSMANITKDNPLEYKLKNIIHQVHSMIKTASKSSSTIWTLYDFSLLDTHLKM